MKTLSIFIASLLMAILSPLSAAAKDNQQNGPAIEFAETTHEFGNISEDGGPVSCQFAFRNTGNAPLVIVTASASCGCTKPKFPPRPIAPGQSGEISVTYNPRGNRGEFDKTVTVRTNIKGRAGKKVLHITGAVIPKP